MTTGLFVTSSGTSAGKTFVTRALARALVDSGERVVALKPIETGCAPHPADAQALARAARADTCEHPTFYRARLALAPYAVELESRHPAPDLSALVAAVRSYEPRCATLLVEGAGGILVPLTRDLTIADFASRLGYPLLMVAPDVLGVLSYVSTACESARARGLRIAAVVLTHAAAGAPDASADTNAVILRERLALPVLHFPRVSDDDAELAAAAQSAGLVHLVTKLRGRA